MLLLALGFLAFTPMAPSMWTPQWADGMQWKTQAKQACYWSRFSSIMERRLWTLVLIFPLLKPQLHVFYYWTKGNGMLENQGFNSTSIKISHSPMRLSENSFSWDITRIPLSVATSENEDLSPLATNMLHGLVSQSSYITLYFI